MKKPRSNFNKSYFSVENIFRSEEQVQTEMKEKKQLAQMLERLQSESFNKIQTLEE
jgi:hypothetical protein